MEEKITEIELHAYVDGLLDDESMARVEALLKRDADATKTVREYISQIGAIRASADARLSPASPTTEILGRRLARKLARPRFPFVRQMMAAAAIFLAGAGSMSALSELNPFADPVFVNEAAEAHVVLADNPFDTESTSGDRLARLFERIGHPVEAADLTVAGLRLSAAHLVATDEGPAIQLVYLTNDDRVVSLLVLDNAHAVPMPVRITRQAGLNMAYWGDSRTRFAVAGHLEEEEILKLTETVRAISRVDA